MTDTIRELINGNEGPALGQPGKPDLTYPALAEAVDRVGRQLSHLGIGPGCDVAIVLPNGPEMAAAFLAVGSYAVAAPLNPSYTEDEFAFYMEDLGARLLITTGDGAARRAAGKLGVAVAELEVGDLPGDIRLLDVQEAPAT